MESNQPLTFAAQVKGIPGGEHLEMCYSCGTCVSTCMIQQKLEPEYNPRRLLRMVMMDMREEAFKSPTTWLCSACDLCYPACPQEIHISGVIGAVKQLAVEAGYTSPLETVVVDEALCSGCGICVMTCPYEAPHLIKKEVNGVMDRFSEVNAEKCMGCGMCVAACPIGAIARPGVSNEDVASQMRIKPQKENPSLVVFVCDWSLRVDEDMALLESYPENVRVIHIPCSGRIDPQMALMALDSGIDGVMVCGCAPGECHFKRGNYISTCKMSLLDRMFGQMELDGGRVRFVQIGTQDRGRIRHEVDNMLTALYREVA
ncbi:MAG: hydrogenase iron-sulfur subunit [Anaerolineaceae bacterium]|nr:hydrogenase iron-sulfur subunit [Anaerolineaceae bacterium]